VDFIVFLEIVVYYTIAMYVNVILHRFCKNIIITPMLHSALNPAHFDDKCIVYRHLLKSRYLSQLFIHYN